MRLIITTAAIASVGGVILYNFFLKGREKNNGRRRKIIVASTSELKVNAAMKAANASVRNVFNVKRTFFFSRNCHYIPLRKRTFFFEMISLHTNLRLRKDSKPSHLCLNNQLGLMKRIVALTIDCNVFFKTNQNINTILPCRSKTGSSSMKRKIHA